MQRIIRTLLSGALVVVPLALTAYIVYFLGSRLDALVQTIIYWVRPDMQAAGWKLFPGLGVLITLVGLYCVGLLTRAWGFRTVFRWVDVLFTKLPGIRTIYESLRDLMKLFGGDSGSMGKAVLYHVPHTGITMLGIMTNDRPAGVDEHTDEHLVAVFLPYGYMFGGIVAYVPPEQLTEVPLSVDQVLKLSATAHVGVKLPPPEGTVKGSETR